MARSVMYPTFFVVLFILTVNGIHHHHQNQNRDARWFNQGGKTLTKTVYETKIVTEPTASSCVVIQTSLPPCRHLRSISPSQTTKMIPTQVPSPGSGWKPIIQPSRQAIRPPKGQKNLNSNTPELETSTAGSWGWGFFKIGSKDVTVTKTIQNLKTSKYMDPNTVVTFSVKGCRPSRLPFDLPECHTEANILSSSTSEIISTTSTRQLPLMTEKGVIVMAPIQFVAGMEPPVAEQKREEEKISEQKKEILNVTTTEK